MYTYPTWKSGIALSTSARATYLDASTTMPEELSDSPEGKAPEVVIEITSKTTNKNDLGKKFDRYRDPEAWNMFLSELVELALWHEDAGTASGISRDGSTADPGKSFATQLASAEKFASVSSLR